MEKEVETLRNLLEDAVGKNCEKEVGVVYSSGIDSSLIASLASRHCKVTAYCAGTEDSEDAKYAKELKGQMGFELRVIEIDEGKVEEILPGLIKAIGTYEPLQVAVGVPLYFAAGEAKKDKLTVLLSGQGGDELFGGYNRYLVHATKGDFEALRKAMQRDAENAYSDNLDRDIAICRSFGIDLRFPYMDKDFSKYAAQLPVELKILEVKDKKEFSCIDEVDGRMFIRKYILRRLGSAVGLPKAVLNRKKKAAQYGSGSEKLIERLARKNGYKKKAMDAGRTDYVRMYLSSLA